MSRKKPTPKDDEEELVVETIGCAELAFDIDLFGLASGGAYPDPEEIDVAFRSNDDVPTLIAYGRCLANTNFLPIKAIDALQVGRNPILEFLSGYPAQVPVEIRSGTPKVFCGRHLHNLR